VSESLYYCIKL